MSDRLEIKITGSNQASAAFQSVTRDATQMGNAVEQSGTKASRSLADLSAKSALVGAAIGSATMVLGEWSRAAAEDAAGQSRLQQSIENTGKSYDEYSQAVDKAIKAGQDKAFSDDATREALVRLNAVTNDTGQSLDQLSLAMDFARAKGISLADSAGIIAKVYGGNLGILSRYGIQLGENATAEEALAKIQQISAGQAATYAASDLGWLDKKKDKWDELTESIGGSTSELQNFLLLLPGLSAAGTAISGLFGGLVGGAGGLAGSTGGLAAFGAAIGSATIALAAFTPALAIVGYTAYTAKDNIAAVTKETNLMADALERVNAAAVANGTATGGTATSAGVDEYATRVYGLVSQYASNVEYTDSNGKTYTLDTVFAQLALLRGEFQDLFIQAARDMQIDFTNPAAEDIQMLIANIVTLRQMQIAAAGYAMGNQNAIGITAPPSTIARVNSTTLIPRGTGPGGQDIGYNAQVRLDLAGPGGQPTGNSPFGSGTSPVTGRAIGGGGSMADYRTGPADSATYSADASNGALQAQAAAVQKLYAAYSGLFDGITSVNDITSAYKTVQDGLIQEQGVYSQQISEYTSQVNAVEAAHEVLNRRVEEGGTLTKEQQEFQDNYTKALERGNGAVDDAVVAQGMLAQQYLLNMEKGDAMNRALGDSATATSELVGVISELILSMDNVPTEVKTQILLNGADDSIDGLIRYYNWISSIPGHVSTVIETIYTVTGSDGETRGRGSGTNRLGGVVGYANGGTVMAELAEAGPELLHFRNGGSAWAMQRGVYNVPKGTYVDTAPASRLKAGSGGGVNNFYGPVTVVANNPQQFFDAMRESAIGGSRS